MNERIRELAKSVQCQRHWTEEDIKKFAELIVKECVKVCSESGTRYDGLWYADQIKEHFGVGE